jgi:hypothetical protein
MEIKITTCQSCGLPLEDPSLHACGDVEIPYCVRCVTPHGRLSSEEQVKAQLIKFYTESLKMKKKDAEKKAEKKLALMFT